eukprot:gene3926-4902_t
MFYQSRIEGILGRKIEDIKNNFIETPNLCKIEYFLSRNEEEGHDLLDFLSYLPCLECLRIIILIPVFCIPKGKVPGTVKEMLLYVHPNILSSYQYKDTLESDSIPLSVDSLAVSHKLIKHDPHNLVPFSVSKLTIDHWSYNGETDLIPLSIKELIISSSYEEYFGDNVVQLVPGCFPPTLRTLNLEYFSSNSPNNTLLTGVIPNSVQELVLCGYNSPIEIGVIPPSCIDIDFGYSFTSQLPPQTIPDGVRIIKFGNNFTPNSLSKSSIPPSVTELSFFQQNELPLEVIQDILQLSKLTRLEIFGCEFQNQLTYFPPTLEYLETSIQDVVTNLFPKSLKYLVLASFELNRIEIGSLPESLIELEINSVIKFPVVEGCLPSSLKKLILYGISENEPFPVLPDSLISLTIGNMYAGSNGNPMSEAINDYYNGKPLFDGLLPKSLKSLHITCPKMIWSSPIGLPPSIEYLSLKKVTLKYEVQPLQLFKQLSDLCSSQSNFRFEINCLKFMSLGLDDEFIYYVNDSASVEGFLKKSNIVSQLYNLCLKSNLST